MPAKSHVHAFSKHPVYHAAKDGRSVYPSSSSLPVYHRVWQQHVLVDSKLSPQRWRVAVIDNIGSFQLL